MRLGSWRQFSFDHAYGPDASQQELYAGCVSGLAECVLQGYNATVFAYGPTGMWLVAAACCTLLSKRDDAMLEAAVRSIQAGELSAAPH